MTTTRVSNNNDDRLIKADLKKKNRDLRAFSLLSQDTQPELRNSGKITVQPERELSSELHYSGVSRRGLCSKAIRLGLYTCILYVCIYIHTYIYIYGFLVCRYARSLGLAARQNTPQERGAIGPKLFTFCGCRSARGRPLG